MEDGLPCLASVCNSSALMNFCTGKVELPLVCVGTGNAIVPF